jgi:hypothetical protein
MHDFREAGAAFARTSDGSGRASCALADVAPALFFEER